MFFNTSSICAEILSVIELEWEKVNARAGARPFHTLSFRLIGGATFFTDNQETLHVDEAEIAYVPANYDFKKNAEHGKIIAIHFTTDSQMPEKILRFKPRNPNFFRTEFTKLYDIWNKKQLGFNHESLIKENAMKKILSYILSLLLIATLFLSLFACENSEYKITEDFVYNNNNGTYNAIKIDFGDGTEAIYFIDENYGIWEDGKETFMFYIILTKRGRTNVEICKYSSLTYFQARVENRDFPVAYSSENIIFCGDPVFSNDGTVATFGADVIFVNKMSSKAETMVTMTKIKLPSDEIIPHDIFLQNMKFVPDVYFKFTADMSSSQFSCEIANFWVDGATMTGEWNTNGSIIPIRMELHEKVPYVEIYDISESSEKLILKSYATVVDEYSIELVAPEGIVFYTTPTSPVIITKTK